MSFFKGGTFSVQPPPNFSFSHRTYYPHAKDLWDAYSNIWENIKNKFGGAGTTQGAEKIQRGLEYINKYTPSGEMPILEEEKELIKEILGRKKLSILDYSKSLGFRARGAQFESIMANIISALTEGPKIKPAGAKKSESPLEIKLQIDLSGKGIGQTKGNVEKLWDIVNEDSEKRLQDFIGDATLALEKIIYEGNNSTLGQLLIRQAKGTQVIDISARGRESKFTIESEVSQSIKDLAEELAGHTFSLKNYQGKTLSSRESGGWGGVSLGYSNIYRAYSSFFYGATGKKMNFADISTFIFASNYSNNPQVHKYLSWARFVYELTGLGQEDVADYLIINTSDKNVTDVRVYAMSDLLKDMPYGNPGAKLQTVSWINWKGEKKTGEKFIFEVN